MMEKREKREEWRKENKRDKKNSNMYIPMTITEFFGFDLKILISSAESPNRNEGWPQNMTQGSFNK